jgi:hypothetical protein
MFFVPYKFAGYGISKVFTPLIMVEEYVKPLVKPKSIPQLLSPKILNAVLELVKLNLPLLLLKLIWMLEGITPLKYVIKVLAL